MWSFQRADFVERVILSSRIFRPEWTHLRDPKFKLAYRWMVDKMVSHGIPMANNAPFWAWKHACAPDERSSLFTQAEVTTQVKFIIIEFDNGDAPGLESSYRGFTNLILALGRGQAIDGAREADVFTIRDEKDVQVSLPYLDTTTITSLTPYTPPDRGRNV